MKMQAGIIVSMVIMGRSRKKGLFFQGPPGLLVILVLLGSLVVFSGQPSG